MSVKDKMQSWRWRITKAGHSLSSFGKTINISSAMMSRYAAGTSNPSLKTFDKIEDKLKELGV